MSLKDQSESFGETDRVQSTVCSFEIATDKKLGKQQLQEYEAGDALDSDETLPNIELDFVIDNNVLNGPSQKLNDGTHINEDNNNKSQEFDEEDDDFGSFDDGLENFDHVDNSFENFDTAPPEIQQIPVFDTLSEALDLWQKLLDQLYDQHKPLDSFTSDAPNSIRVYVLEEASESLHSRLTWDSVTRYMDNDTGIPKVRWYQSEIEKIHLKALACKRSPESVLHTRPSMLDATGFSNYSHQSSSPEPVNNIPADPPTFEDISISTATAASNNSTPASDKRSPVFGRSSFSKYLPHLTKTKLPRSPTSPKPQTPSQSLPGHQDASIPSTMTFNHMNIRSDNVHRQQNVSNDISMGKLKRSNTVAFSSIRAKASNNSILNLLDDDDQDTKPRPTSFHGTSSQTKPTTISMDLFDLTDDGQVLKSPTSLQFSTSSIKPLVPTVRSVSPSTCIPATNTIANRRNTLPASNRSDTILAPITMNAHLNTVDDDEFGDFTDEQENGFDDFTNTPPKSDIHDPFGSLNYTQPKPQPQQHVRSMSTPHTLSNMILTPTQVTPLTTDDTVSSSEKKEDSSDLFSFIEEGSTVQMNVDLFDFNVDMSSKTVTDQSNALKNKIDNDDDDWGDWAF